MGHVDEWSRGEWERIEGFKTAAQVLTDFARNEEEPVASWMIYPVVYVYRHTIELRLKYAIRDGHAFLGESVSPSGHDLTRLWEGFIAVVDRSGVGAAWDWSDCESVVLELQQVDTRSAEAFRYPVARDGTTPLPSTDVGKVDIGWMGRRFDKLLETLEGWESALDAKREARGGSS